MAKPRQNTQVYAVLRHDGFLDDLGGPQNTLKVKEIVYDLETAQREVDRLNALQSEFDVTYWWQATRLYPPGSAASEAGAGDRDASYGGGGAAGSDGPGESGSSDAGA